MNTIYLYIKAQWLEWRNDQSVRWLWLALQQLTSLILAPITPTPPPDQHSPQLELTFQCWMSSPLKNKTKFPQMIPPHLSFLHPPPQSHPNYSPTHTITLLLQSPPQKCSNKCQQLPMFTTYRGSLFSLCFTLVLNGLWNYFLFSPLTSNWFLLRMTISSSEYILNPHYLQILYLGIHMLKHFCNLLVNTRSDVQSNEILSCPKYWFSALTL